MPPGVLQPRLPMVRKRGGARPQQQPVPEPAPVLHRFFHARTCMPMTPEEVAAGKDSDDELDVVEWRVGLVLVRFKPPCRADAS